MPLSEHEERLLAQMEEALKVEDPRLVSTLTGERHARGSLTLPLLLILVGFATLIGGLVSQVAIVGVMGFTFALAGFTWVLRAFQGPASTSRSRNGGSSTKTSFRRSMMERMEERWDRPEE